MHFRVTIRFGRQRKGYHVASIEADDLVSALRQAADEMPPEVAGEADLAEIRRAATPEDRPGQDVGDPSPGG